jgi:hypothetical protein
MNYKVYGFLVNRFIMHTFAPSYRIQSGALNLRKILSCWNPFSSNLSSWNLELRREMDLEKYYFFSIYWERL